LATAAGEAKMMRELASGLVPIPFGVAVLVTAVFSSTPGPSPNIQSIEDAVPAKTTVIDFPLRPIDAPKLELALPQSVSLQDQPAGVPDQPAVLASVPDQPATLASVPDQPAILSDQPAILASVRDQPASVPDQPAILSGQLASVRDRPASAPDQPASVPNQLASVQDKSASVSNPPPPKLAEIVPLPKPRPPSVPLSRPRRQTERPQAQVERQSFFDFFTGRFHAREQVE
jgi:hypothetical protein